MDVISFSETRANLKSVMDQVVRDRTPIVVSRKNGESIVMVSLADWTLPKKLLTCCPRRLMRPA
jgi:antitoxin YefM